MQGCGDIPPQLGEGLPRYVSTGINIPSEQESRLPSLYSGLPQLNPPPAPSPFWFPLLFDETGPRNSFFPFYDSLL